MSIRLLLRIESGPHKGKTWIFSDPGVYVFGRADECFEILPNEDPSVGRRHFALEMHASSARIRDLGSRNGTTVNGEKLTRSVGRGSGQFRATLDDERHLKDGDAIGAGKTRFSVRLLEALKCAGCGASLGQKDEDVWGPKASAPVFCRQCFEAGERVVSKTVVDAAVCGQCGESRPGAEVADAEADGYVCDECSEKTANAAVVERRMTQMASESIPRGARRLAIDSLEIQRAIGSAVGSTVYLATLGPGRSQVAVKVLATPHLSDARRRTSVARELRSSEDIDHPRIVRLLDFAVDQRAVYMVMEYCEMGDLRRLLRSRGGKLGQQEALPLLINVLEGLVHAHGLGVTHGRLKPTNVLLTKTTSGPLGAKIADLWRPIEDPKSPAKTRRDSPFQPPAQVLGLLPGAAQADLWSLAATFYNALTGEFPIPSAATPSTPSIIPLKGRDPTILGQLADAIDRSLGVHPAGFYTNAAEMLGDARSVLKSYVRLTLRTE